MGEGLTLAPFLTALLGAGVGTFGGYLVGLAQSRNERRDNALAEISKEMMLFYRGVVTWTSPDETSGPLTEPGTSWHDHCMRQYAAFIDALYANEIWLGKATHEKIQEVAEAGRVFLNGVDTRGRVMQDGTSAWDWRAERLAPKLNEVQDVLRAEVEASRYIIPYRIPGKRGVPKQDG